MIENHLSFTLAVQQERLRHRTPLPPPKHPPASANCSPAKENISPDAGQLLPRARINWIKFNILVSIYQNWLRLEPFIRYWLQKRYERGEKEDPLLWPYLHRRKEGEAAAPNEPKEEEEQSDLFQQMRMRRQQLLKGLEPSPADLETLSKARHLARQMLSTLSIENTKWTKVRIEKQNRLFDEMINSFNEEQFQKNSEVIMHSIKERLFFIDQLQKKYLDYNKEQKQLLDQKIELLKQPFKKVFESVKGKAEVPEALFESLWKEIECERTKVLNKKPQLRHTHKPSKNKHRYAIMEKSDSGLVIKYQIKHSDYFNESYLRSKYHKTKIRKGKNFAKSSEGGEESMQASIYGQPTKDSVEEQMNEDSSIASDPLIDPQQQQINRQYAEDFLRRQRQKQGYRDQQSNFLKKSVTKQQSYSHYRPSISYVDGRSPNPSESAIRSNASFTRDRTSLFARRDSRRKPTDDEEAEKEDHLSRFKSHKKLITLKNIGGVNRYTKIRDSSRKADNSQESYSRVSGKLSKLQKKEFRKETLQLRKGMHWKKGGNRKELQENSIEQQCSPVPQNIFNLSKQEFIAYFNKILTSGHLNHDRHEELRERVKGLLKKHEPAALEQTHLIVEKLVEKSAQNEYSSLLGQGRAKLLMDLYGVVSKDECIKAKIREQMKIFFNEDPEEDTKSEDSFNNEQQMYHTTELRKVNQQLKRIVCFRNEGEAISFANRMVKHANSLQQCQV